MAEYRKIATCFPKAFQTMNADDTSPDLNALARFSARLESGVSGGAQVVARQRYRLRAVVCDQPVLIIPLAGEKTVHDVPAPLRITPGQFVVLHRPQTVDIENRPEMNDPYRAWCLPFPWPVVELARQFLQQQALAAFPSPGERNASRGDLEPLLPSLFAWLDQQNADPIQQDYARLGLLLALARSGHGDFLRALAPGLAHRIRLMVATDPAREWTSAHFETAFNISAATLRRRLVAETTSLRDVLREARLHHALALLQTSKLPLKSIALASGYRSQSSFRQNFSDRFGLSPADVAGVGIGSNP